MTRVGSLPASFVAAGAILIAFAPDAGADSAQATIDALQDQGYIVAINWVDGNTNAPLATCRVVAVHNPDSSGGDSSTAITVYVDLSCPRGQAPIGIGAGIGF